MRHIIFTAAFLSGCSHQAPVAPIVLPQIIVDVPVVQPTKAVVIDTAGPSELPLDVDADTAISEALGVVVDSGNDVGRIKDLGILIRNVKQALSAVHQAPARGKVAAEKVHEARAAIKALRSVVRQ